MENEKTKVNNPNKKFIIGYIIFALILLTITGLAIYFTIENMNKKSSNEAGEQITPKVDKAKTIAEDSKYAIKSYDETYNENPVTITEYYDIDGEIVTSRQWDDERKYINFIQIEGLKDKKIQSKINDRLKEKSYSFKESNNALCNVTANFANILSVSIADDTGKTETLNINLNTGEDIPFEKVFVSSAPLNSLLSEGLYEKLAWDSLWDKNRNIENGADIEDTFDMGKADTSTYEDKFLMLLNNYKKQKGNIKYNISPSQVDIYGLIDEKISKEEYGDSINIDFINHIEDIAIYKRYLSSNSIYEDDSLGNKNIIVLVRNMEAEKYFKNLMHEKIKDNIFMEEAIIYDIDDIDASVISKIENYITRTVEDNKKEELKNKTDKSKGLFFQREYRINKSENGGYEVTSKMCQATCDISYFKGLAFKDYIRLKNRAVPDLSLIKFEDDEYTKKDYPNLEILDTTYKIYYFSDKGIFNKETKEMNIEEYQNYNNQRLEEENTDENEENEEDDNHIQVEGEMVTVEDNDSEENTTTDNQTSGNGTTVNNTQENKTNTTNTTSNNIEENKTNTNNTVVNSTKENKTNTNVINNM